MMSASREADVEAILSTQGSSAAPAVPSFAVEDVGASERADWDDFVRAAPGAELYHDYRWRSLIHTVFGHESLYLIARDGRRAVRGVLPLVRLRSRLFGDFLVSVPYFNYGGILADSAAAAQALAAAAAQRAAQLGAGHVELRHRDRLRLEWPAREDKVTMLLELPESEEALLKSFSAKLRSQIRRPTKEGATVRQGGAELLPDFYAVFARNMRDLGTPVYPRAFFDAIFAAFSTQARAFVVDLGGKPVAAGIVLTHRTTAEIPWASSLREANRSGANMLLYGSVLRDAIERGCRRFDFGRSTRDSGTYRFKQQWGAQPQQLRWHYWLAGGELPRLTPSNPKYQAAIALWRKLPLPVANWLGPRIVKNLP
jgi:serine/alanine adding enzyme